MTVELNRLSEVSNTANQLFDEIVERIGDFVEAGRMNDAMRLIDGHPEHAERLRRLLPTIEALASFDELPGERVQGAENRSRQLGDFRILREIGRGGMGVVYEAEQISLGRRVGLKVLPLAAMLDNRRLERFRHEAQAAAMLRHPHIVTVYSVGCERGVHYYAMDYIEGPSLAEVVAHVDAVSRAAPSDALELHRQGPARLAGPTTLDTAPVAALATLRTDKPAEFFRAVARLGIQAAEALDYAHQMGVVHRDIKPSNLLLDGNGKLWITDFGLALTQTDAGLTMTGDLLGTLRYMSPEQTAGKRLPLDHRTDIYSLGITLYEMLAGRPAFETAERGQLLRSIVESEPTPLRKLAPTVSADLETIIHKAIEKDAADRYATAQEMSNDLRRFSENRPIQARRPTALKHLRKFVRRHRALTVIVSIGALLLLSATVAFVADRRRHNLESRRILAASVQNALIGYWPFDGDGKDASPLGHDLTIQGRAAFAPGLFGQSLDLHKNQATYAQRPVDDSEYDFDAEDFARDAAAARTYGSVFGHLATVTSQAENDFLFGLRPDPTASFSGAWIAVKIASGLQTWEIGPEAGTTLVYENWGGIEPNNGHLAGLSAYGYIHIGSASFGGIAPGQWADAANGIRGDGDPVAGYFVEYEAIPEPSAAVLCALVLVPLARRRRKSLRIFAPRNSGAGNGGEPT